MYELSLDCSTSGWREEGATDVEQACVLERMLELTRAQVWGHAQTRMGELLDQCKLLSNARVEEFARVAAATETFIHFGESLTGRRGLLRDRLRGAAHRFCAAYRMRLLSTLQTALESDFWQPYPCSADFDLGYLHELEPFLPHSMPKLDATLEQVRQQRQQQQQLQLEVPAGAELGEARAVSNPFDHYKPHTVQLPAPVSGVGKETVVAGERHTVQGVGSP